MARARRILTGGALAAFAVTLAGCAATPPPPPAPVQVPVPVAPPPTPVAEVAPAPLTDQPPIAAPTERVAVTPLGAPEAPETAPPLAPVAMPPEAAPPAPIADPSTLQGAVLTAPAAVQAVVAPVPETTPGQDPVAVAVAPPVMMAPVRSAGDPPANPSLAPQSAVLVEPAAPAAPATEAPAPQVPAVVLAGIPSSPPVPEARPRPDPRFDEFIRSFRAEALRAGIRAETYDRAMTGISVNARVAEALVTQPEFVRPVWDYLATATSDLRVTGGRERLAAEDALFDRLEATYEVPREVVAAVWAMESNYGRILGSYNLFEALANLAYDGRRQDFGRQQLLAALKIAQDEGIDPKLMVSSWAGAFGQTQFIPTTFLERAVDGDGDGVRNLWKSHADALASAAVYLKRSGWQADRKWGEEVRLPENFPYDDADPGIKKPQREWAALGVRTAAGQELPASDEPVSILLPAGARGPAFLIGANFQAILRYNNATSYALAVGLLSDRFKGEQGIIAAWPRDEQPLNREQRVALQTGLTALGFPTGNADGILGAGTRNALKNFQKARGLPADGFASIAVLNRINEERSKQ